jgi:hypothetical protein
MGDKSTKLMTRANGTADPDPFIGPYRVSDSKVEPQYEAGVDPIYDPTNVQTSTKMHHWITNYVTIEGINQPVAQQMGGLTDSAFDENGNVMTGP